MALKENGENARQKNVQWTNYQASYETNNAAR
jgi:hypothetical protein